MSFDKILKGEKDTEKVSDPKLKKYLDKLGTIKSTSRPNIELVERKVHRPSSTIRLVMDGVEKRPEGEVLEVYKCNKCGRSFNHPESRMLQGIPPKCPDCD